MKFLQDKGKRRAFIIGASVAVAVIALVALAAVYVGDYYRADKNAVDAFEPIGKSEYTVTEGDPMIFEPEGATVGFIFYPGGKVEYTAYIPLMEACASEGILSVLVEMPFNLAVLDVNAADEIRERYPEIESWYIGGHSLGGSMAASYLAEHTEDFDGLILLGSYSTADLSASDLSVLSIYGSEDGVMNREKYAEYMPNLPDGYTEVIIDGGCHAYFGMYGEQDKDGMPTISSAEQINLTAGEILKLISSGE